MFVERPVLHDRMATALARSRVVALVGPRQIGKTTLARQFVAPDSINYFDLEDSVSLARLMVRQLPSWHANLLKRQVKSPKIYFRDTGLLHTLLGIHSAKALEEHPKSGASWEGYVIEEVFKSVQPEEGYFWATHGGAELDLLLIKDDRRVGVECKRVDAPRMTPSMRAALNDLTLDRLVIIYPGVQRYRLGERVEVMPLSMLRSENPKAVLDGD